MPVTITSGDLFASGAQTLVNATNTEGIMGGGIALAFKNRFPEMYRDYVHACENGEHTVRIPHLYRYDAPWILNIASKDLMRNDSTLDNIALGLTWLAANYEHEGITSIALPALGCGLGGCDWEDVKPLMLAFLETMDIPIMLYKPQS